MDNKYQSGKIYKITSPSTDKIYIGSTWRPLNERFNGHTSNYRLGRPASSKEIIRYTDSKIELLEDYPCKSKIDLEEREKEYILLHRAKCVNKLVPRRSRHDSYMERQDYYLQKNALWRENNQDEIKAYRLIEMTCECGATIRKIEKARHEKKCKRHLNFMLSKLKITAP